MKAKAKETFHPYFKVGKFYTVSQHPVWNDRWLVVGDNGKTADFYKSRFEEPFEDSEEKKEELKEKLEKARTHVAQLEKEIKDLEVAKIGQKYQHKENKNKYIVTRWREQFGLVCYEGSWLGGIYHYASCLEDVFGNKRNKFIFLSE